MQKTLFTTILLIVSVFIVYRIQDFVEKNRPAEVFESAIVTETPSHITTFEVVDSVKTDKGYRVVDSESTNTEVSMPTPSL